MTLKLRELSRRFQSWVLLVRALSLVLAGALAAAGLALVVREPATPNVAERWSCPMHPEVSAAVPGQCSICKMALESSGGPERAGSPKPPAEHPPDCPMHAKPAADAGASYSCPMHPKIRADAPGSCSVCKMQLVPARSGAGSGVKAADPTYGPGVSWIPEAFPPPERGKPGDRPVLDTPKRRAFQGRVLAWAVAETPEKLAVIVYRDELAGLSPGRRGTFSRASAPRVPVPVRLSDEPAEAWDAATSLVRFTVEPPSGAVRAAIDPLREGEVGSVDLGDVTRELLAFPEHALLRGESGPYVLVANRRGEAFTRRPVQIGRILKGQVVVLAGLREDERIVQSSVFFLDTERGRDPGAGPTAEIVP